MVRFNATNSVNDSIRSGRPKATMHRQDYLIRTPALRNRTISARAVQRPFRTAAGVTVSDQTILNRLHVADLRACGPVERIPLKQRHRIHRLDCVDVICDGMGFIGLEKHFQTNLVSTSTSMTIGCAFTDVVVNNILTSMSKNMTVTEEGQ